MPEKEFKVGDVVILKSGGPAMTVDEIDDDKDTIECRWFGDGKKLEYGSFPIDTLERAGTSGSFS